MFYYSLLLSISICLIFKRVSKYRMDWILKFSFSKRYLRNSIEKDYHNALKYRAEGFIDKLIPILDSFYVVLKNEPDDPKLKNYLIGFSFLYKNLVSALEEEGVTEILPKEGDKFDSNVMEVIETVKGETANIITEVKRKGYKLHDRLIRPAGVVVTVVEQDEEKEKSDC